LAARRYRHASRDTAPSTERAPVTLREEIRIGDRARARVAQPSAGPSEAVRFGAEPNGLLGLGPPLTERVLAHLGAPRRLWVVLWSGSALLIPFALLVVLAQEGSSDRAGSVSDLIVAQLALSYAALLGIWGSRRLTTQARSLPLQLSSPIPASIRSQHPARYDIAGPSVLAIAVTLVASIGWVVRFGPVAALAILLPFVLTMLPIMTFVWTYLEVLVGLDRLGRTRLALVPFPQDTSLGLSPIGSIAFTGFAVVLAGTLPIPLTNGDDLISVAMSLAVLGVSVVLFVLSMWRIHGQMVAAKSGYIAETQAAYAEAYEPYRRNKSLRTLEAQAPLLAIAHTLDERAHRIREWPIDERLVRVAGFSVAALASATIGRLVVLSLAS
jgi:hypothetical protein